MGYVNILIVIPDNREIRPLIANPEPPNCTPGAVCLYGYELVTFASRHNHFRRPHGFFRSGLLGLRRARELTVQ
jgi:hypothetical protein